MSPQIDKFRPGWRVTEELNGADWRGDYYSRMSFSTRFIASHALAISMAGMAMDARADWRTASGWDALAAELGNALPNGSGVVVMQAEASSATQAPYDYLPQAGGPDAFAGTGNYAGKTFHPESGTGTLSNHANSVATRFYSTTASIAPGVTEVFMMTANDFVDDVFVEEPPPSFPSGSPAKVQNHSWVGTFKTPENQSDASDVKMLRKLDYILNRDNVIACVGLRNDSVMAELLGNFYHGVTVGNLAGNHSLGGTNTDGSGRMKPDLVVDEDLTSYSTGAVSSAAAFMVDAARTLGTADADDLRVIKALMIAGASKSNLPGWQRLSFGKPYDAVFGAGELNVYHPWHMLNAGRQVYSNSAKVGTRGWDFSKTSTSAPRRYFFTVPEGRFADRLSVALSWNRNVVPFIYTFTLSNLNLTIRKADGFVPGTQVDASISSVDNVEHVFQRNLPAGDYVLEVSANSNNRDYAIAWNAELGAGPQLLVTRDGSGVTVQAENLDPFVTYTLVSSPDLVGETVVTSFRTADTVAATSWSWMDEESPVPDRKFYWLRWTAP